jgi:hypothetical protein
VAGGSGYMVARFGVRKWEGAARGQRQVNTRRPQPPTSGQQDVSLSPTPMITTSHTMQEASRARREQLRPPARNAIGTDSGGGPRRTPVGMDARTSRRSLDSSTGAANA